MNLPGYDDLVLPADRELMLRPWRAGDELAVAAVYRDPASLRFIEVFRGAGPDTARDFVASAAQKWADRRHLRLCLCPVADPAVVLGSGDVDDLRLASGLGDLGWWVTPEVRARGLGVRLARLLVRTAFEVIGLHRVTAQVVAVNAASRWVAAGAGLRRESSARESALAPDGSRLDLETWRLLASEPPLEPQPDLTAGVLHLRPWLPSDASACVAASRDPQLQRWMPWAPRYDLADASTWCSLTALGAWASGAGAHFAVVDAVSGGLLGGVGATWLEAGVADVGWWLVREARGRGLATAAVRTLCRWLVGQGARMLVCRTAVGNAASAQVAERVGFTREGVLRARLPVPGGDGDRCDAVSFSLLAGDVR